MRSQTYGDKQREAQRRKKQEELLKKTSAESVPDADKSNQALNKTEKKNTPKGRSA
jgi:hypothetical protein